MSRGNGWHTTLWPPFQELVVRRHHPICSRACQKYRCRCQQICQQKAVEECERVLTDCVQFVLADPKKPLYFQADLSPKALVLSAWRKEAKDPPAPTSLPGNRWAGNALLRPEGRRRVVQAVEQVFKALSAVAIKLSHFAHRIP